LRAPEGCVAISSEKARLLRFTRNDNSYSWIWVKYKYSFWNIGKRNRSNTISCHLLLFIDSWLTLSQKKVLTLCHGFLPLFISILYNLTRQ